MQGRCWSRRLQGVGASHPNELWVVDFTYVAIWSGMAFTAFVTDVFSRRIVGWRCHGSLPTALPLDALEMARWTRQRTGQDVTGVVHHSDAGSQYTSIRYGNRLAGDGAMASIGSVGDSYDNALAQTVVGLYKDRMRPARRTLSRSRRQRAGHPQLGPLVNTNRLHSSIGNIPPIEYEQQHYRQTGALTEDNAALAGLH